MSKICTAALPHDKLREKYIRAGRGIARPCGLKKGKPMSGFDFDLDALKAKAAELADKAGLDTLAAKAQEVSDKAGLADVLAKLHAKVDADGDGMPDILEKVVDLADKAGIDEFADKAAAMADKAGLGAVADAARELSDKINPGDGAAV